MFDWTREGSEVFGRTRGLLFMALLTTAALLPAAGARATQVSIPMGILDITPCLEPPDNYSSCNRRVIRFFDPGIGLSNWPFLRLKIKARCVLGPDAMPTPMEMVFAWPRGLSQGDPATSICDLDELDIPGDLGEPGEIWPDEANGAGLVAPPERTKTWRSGWEIRTEGGQRLAAGRITISTRVYRAAGSVRVWSSDFDRYWNICVRSALDVYAQGGRFYCDRYQPGRARYVVRLG